jgi:hypothetical protein
LWPFVVVVVFWPLPRFSPFVVAVLLSCPVRTTTKEMDHNFVSLSLCCQRNGWERKPDRKKGKKKLPTGTQAVRMRAGAFVWRASILSLPSLFSTSYSSLHDGARPVSSSSPVAITPTHLTGSSLPFHSSKLGPNVTPLLPSHTRFFLLLSLSSQIKSIKVFQPQFFSDFFSTFCFSPL